MKSHTIIITCRERAFQVEENRYARLQKTSGIECVHKVGIVSSKQGWNQEGNRHTKLSFKAYRSWPYRDWMWRMGKG